MKAKLLRGFPFRDGKTSAPPVPRFRVSSRIASARCDKGTRCALRAFIWDAGTVHVAASVSTFPHSMKSHFPGPCRGKNQKLQSQLA